LWKERVSFLEANLRFVEGTSFFSGSKPKGRILVNNVAKHKNKVVESDVVITVVLEVKLIKNSFKIF